MSVVIRLARIGKRGTSIYRIVAIDKRARRNGSPLEILGTYTSGKTQKDIGVVTVNKERIVYWQARGSAMSPAITKILSFDK